MRRYTCRCRACGERTTLRSLPAPYERSKVTCEWLAWFVYHKFWLLTPLDRIRRDLAERGIPLAMGTLVSFIERTADLLSGIDGLHWKQLLASSWMATDGTGIKVIVPKLPAAHNGYLELYRNDELAVFQYEPTKNGDLVAAKLRPFRGTLTADAEHRFNDVFASGHIIEAAAMRTEVASSATLKQRSPFSLPRRSVSPRTLRGAGRPASTTRVKPAARQSSRNTNTTPRACSRPR